MPKPEKEWKKKKNQPKPETQCEKEIKEAKKKKRKKSVLERAKGLTVGLMYVCLFTKMPWKLSFDNLKTPKMCFQFL